MGQRLSGPPLGRPKEHSRFVALLSLAALAAYFRLLLQAGRQNRPSAVGRDERVARDAGGFDSMAAAERATVASRAAAPRRAATPVHSDAGRASAGQELAPPTGPAAWVGSGEAVLPDPAELPESPVAVVELDRAPVKPGTAPGDVEASPFGPELDGAAAIWTLAQIVALPEIEPRVVPAPVTPGVEAPRPRPIPLSGNRAWRLALLAIAGLALALRLINHSSNYDVFIDEITYSTIGQAVALGHGVSLYGTPFFLHPPLFFYLEAGVLNLFGGAHATPVQLVLDLRPINCVIGAIECVLLTALVSRFSSRRAALAVGVFAACDPFLLLWDGRVLLETQAMTLAVAGWLCLDWIARVEMAAAEGHPRGRRGLWAMIVLGGLLFGGSLLSKETYAFVGVAPLLAMAVIGSPLRRRITASMFAIAAGCYGIYLLTVALAGHLSLWWSQNSAGLQRAAGTKQITGFNQAGHHASLSGSVTADLSLYLVSYLVIAAIGLAAATGVIRWLRAARAGRVLGVQRRLAIVLGAGAVGYVGYAVMFGAFETQIFYMCIIGGLPVLVTELRACTWRRITSLTGPRALMIGCVAMLAVALVFELSVDVRLRTERDTSLSQLVDYVAKDVPNGAMVDSTDQVTQFILQGVQIDGPRTVRGLERGKPGYVVVDEGLVAKGYDSLGPGFQRWLARHAHVVFSTTGRSTGRLLLYRTEYADADPGA